ncbi:VOC family protein [Rhodococcus sp. HNM0569]|uniref:VOC family protein n=1 Tax=Rhodococcus sp. HNM0569 TaxID=2716340 RepID=UPI001469AA17|nr:VOC family protein [Rhodococcus sp. HNM0569]NLU84307.1 VOC family protein [Rhodococcus sp. HNM0569]
MSALRPVSNVFYFVDDLDAGIEWYARLLGERPDERPDSMLGRLARFSVGPAVLTVHVSDEYNKPSRTDGPVAYWEVDDVDTVVADCTSRGATVHRGPKTIFTGERLCQVLDPFGNLIGFVSRGGAGATVT